MADSTQQIGLSVVIPIYNERDNLEPLLNELEETLRQVGRPFEVICVDDRSTDDSLQILQRLKGDRPWLRVIRHNINSGESAGEATGFRHARGELIVTMDGDQQNDPADIPMMLEAMEADVAAVCGVRRIREDDWVRRASSRIANRFRNAVTGDRILDAGCTFRILRRSALGEVLVFNGMHRFLPTILRLQGYRVVELLVNHRPRTRGKSKYGVGNRAWRGLVDCLAMRWYRARCLRGNRTNGNEI
jgi:glycosyltransferase involved in cell wall biosynthesis